MSEKFNYFKKSYTLNFCFLFCITACIVSCKNDSDTSVNPQEGVVGIWRIKSWTVTPEFSGSSDYLQDENPACWKNVRYQFYQDGTVILRAPKECEESQFEDDPFSTTYWKVRGNKIIFYYEQNKIDDGDEFVLEVNSREMSLTSRFNWLNTDKTGIQEHIVIQKFERL